MVYSTYDSFTTVPGNETYCHPTLYWFAFWQVTSVYIAVGASIVVCCLYACCLRFT